jgi:hypothetical protein
VSHIRRNANIGQFGHWLTLPEQTVSIGISIRCAEFRGLARALFSKADGQVLYLVLLWSFCFSDPSQFPLKPMKVFKIKLNSDFNVDFDVDLSVDFNVDFQCRFQC